MQHRPLFESQHIRLTPIDPEKDAQVIASWTSELEIAARLREDQPVRPMATLEVKKLYERWQKDADDSQRQFLFGIRLRNGAAQVEQDPMIGVLRIKWIEYVHGASYLDLILSNPQDWMNYAREALDLAVRYAFEELNLFRVTSVVAEHDQRASQLFEQANFTLEVRQREAVYWDKRPWDKLFYGLLRPEWQMMQAEEVAA